jgi:hypothetical protein
MNIEKVFLQMKGFAIHGGIELTEEKLVKAGQTVMTADKFKAATTKACQSVIAMPGIWAIDQNGNDDKTVLAVMGLALGISKKAQERKNGVVFACVECADKAIGVIIKTIIKGKETGTGFCFVE